VGLSCSPFVLFLFCFVFFTHFPAAVLYCTVLAHSVRFDLFGLLRVEKRQAGRGRVILSEYQLFVFSRVVEELEMIVFANKKEGDEGRGRRKKRSKEKKTEVTYPNSCNSEPN